MQRAYSGYHARRPSTRGQSLGTLVEDPKGRASLQCHLKGHCHAIWQLNKSLEGALASIEFQN